MPQTLVPTEPIPCLTTAAKPMRWLTRRALLKGIALGLLVMFVAECLRIFAGSNFHTVVPGKCYRSAQPTPTLLEGLKQTHGIRSVVNLRGCDNLDQQWFIQEDAACKRLNLPLYDAGLASNEQPPEIYFQRFVQVMKDAQEPILIHCANGNDRTGLASAVYLLMRTDASITQARSQLSVRYGHIAWGRVLCLHRILDSYEAWLRHEEAAHTPERFYYWGMKVYQQEMVK